MQRNAVGSFYRGLPHRLAALVAVALTASALHAQDVPVAAADMRPAFARAAHLRRGINLSSWYAQTNDYSAEREAARTNAADFKLIRELGFDHVRVSINPVPLLAEGASTATPALVDPAKPISPTATLPFRRDAMARLDESVRQINAAGLIAVLDIHPEEPWIKAAFTDEGVPDFLYFWRGFAHHFAGTDPNKVYFEVLNEPHAVNAVRWAAEQSKAVAVIRKQAPRHTIIVTGVEYGGIDGLLELDPLADANLIYSFHDYEPMAFTHQGATWAGSALIPLRDVPYPSTEENVAPLVAAVSDPSSASTLQRYGREHWDRARVALRMQMAVDWGKQHHVPVWCGEFGAYSTYSPPADRARWITDMRESFDRLGVGWAMWEYEGSFGLVRKKDGVTTVDPAIANALGVGIKP